MGLLISVYKLDAYDTKAQENGALALFNIVMNGKWNKATILDAGVKQRTTYSEPSSRKHDVAAKGNQKLT